MSSNKEWYNFLTEAVFCVKSHLATTTRGQYSKVVQCILVFAEKMLEDKAENGIENEFRRICEDPKYLEYMKKGMITKQPGKNFSAPGEFFTDGSNGISFSLDSDTTMNVSQQITAAANRNTSSKNTKFLASTNFPNEDAESDNVSLLVCETATQSSAANAPRTTPNLYAYKESCKYSIKFREVLKTITDVSTGDTDNVSKGNKVNMFFCKNVANAFVSFITRERTSLTKETREEIVRNKVECNISSPYNGAAASNIKNFLTGLLDNQTINKYVEKYVPGATPLVKGVINNVNPESIGNLAAKANSAVRTGKFEGILEEVTSIGTEVFGNMPATQDGVDSNDQI